MDMNQNKFRGDVANHVRNVEVASENKHEFRQIQFIEIFLAQKGEDIGKEL